MVRKKSFDRTVVKKCPKCDQQVPVACKYCPCGHQFWSKKFPSLSSSSSLEDESSTKVRRTERTRRDSQRPDYFNSIVIETQSRRRKKSSSTRASSPAESTTTEVSQSESITPGRKRRGRPKTTPSKPPTVDTESEKEAETPQSMPEEEEVDIHADLPPLRIQQFKYILMDINAKFVSQNFKPS